MVSQRQAHIREEAAGQHIDLLFGRQFNRMAQGLLGPAGAAFYLWDHAVKRGDIRALGALSYATPILSSETLTAQSANIDTVSGATYTSNSYKVSLQSAIDLARATALKSGTTA